MTQMRVPDAAKKAAEAEAEEAAKKAAAAARKAAKTLAIARDFEALPDSASVPDAVVAALNCVNRSTVWRWVKKGSLPQPEKVGPHTSRFSVGKLRRARQS